MLSRLKCCFLVCLLSLIGPAVSSAAQQPASAEHTSADVALENLAWQKALTEATPAGRGCFRATYPSITLTQVPCVPAPAASRIAPPNAFEKGGRKAIGDGTGYFLLAPTGQSIFRIVGSFPSTKGVRTVSSVGSSQTGKNTYSLQINAATSKPTSVCQGLGDKCRIWQQFVYQSPTDNSQNTAYMYILYWLFGASSCPPPLTTGDGIVCVYSTEQMAVPVIPATDLDKVQFWGYSQPGFNDRLYLVYKGAMHALYADGSPLRLGEAWDAAEFNIFGYDDGGEAVFNSQVAIDVRLEAAFSGSQVAPQCTATDPGVGTAETNNLQLIDGSCTAWGYPNPAGVISPYIQFTQKSQDQVLPLPLLEFLGPAIAKNDKMEWVMQIKRDSVEKPQAPQAWEWAMWNDIGVKGQIGFHVNRQARTVEFNLAGDEGSFQSDSSSCHGNTGQYMSCSVPYTLVVGHPYSFTAARTFQDSGKATWTGTVTDKATGISTTIGSVSAPGTWSFVHDSGTAQALLDPLTAQSQTCSELPFMSTIINAPAVYENGKSLPIVLSNISGGCITYTPLSTPISGTQYEIELGGAAPPN